MKIAVRYIWLIVVLVASAIPNLQARTQSPDTLYYNPEASSMIVTDSKDEVTVNIRSHRGQETIILKNEDGDDGSGQTMDANKRSSDIIFKGHNLFLFPSRYDNSFWSIGIDGVTIGLSSANGQDHPKGFQWAKSIEIGWLNAVAIKYNLRNSIFSLGVGLNWKNFRNSTSARYLDYNEEEGMFWKNYEEGINGKGSRLMIFSVQFPLLWQYTFPSTSLSLKLGPVFNLNTFSEIKSHYLNNEGDKCSRSLKNVKPRLFTTDIFASLSLYNVCGIYLRYSPVRIMQDRTGLNFHPLTIGMTVGI